MTRKRVVVIAIIFIILGILIPVCCSSKGLFKREVHEYASTASRTTKKTSDAKPKEHIVPTEKQKQQVENSETTKAADKKNEGTNDSAKQNDAKKDDPSEKEAERIVTDNKTSSSNESVKKENSSHVPVDQDNSSQTSSKPAGTVNEKNNEQVKPSAQTQQTTTTKPSNTVSTPSATPTPVKPEHTHSWVEQKKTVHHDAVTSLVWIVDQAAYDEPDYVEEYTYDTISKVQCRACGSEFDTYDQWITHSDSYIDNGDYSHGSYSVVYHQIQTGSQMVPTGTYTHHKEVGHWENQVVKAAYDEEVVTGYKCSGCEATK